MAVGLTRLGVPVRVFDRAACAGCHDTDTEHFALNDLTVFVKLVRDPERALQPFGDQIKYEIRPAFFHAVPCTGPRDCVPGAKTVLVLEPHEALAQTGMVVAPVKQFDGYLACQG